MGRSKEARGGTCGCCGAACDIKTKPDSEFAVECRKGCNAEADGCPICGRRNGAVHGCRCKRKAV